MPDPISNTGIELQPKMSSRKDGQAVSNDNRENDDDSDSANNDYDVFMEFMDKIKEKDDEIKRLEVIQKQLKDEKASQQVVMEEERKESARLKRQLAQESRVPYLTTGGSTEGELNFLRDYRGEIKEKEKRIQRQQHTIDKKKEDFYKSQVRLIFLHMQLVKYHQDMHMRRKTTFGMDEDKTATYPMHNAEEAEIVLSHGQSADYEIAKAEAAAGDNTAGKPSLRDELSALDGESGSDTDSESEGTNEHMDADCSMVPRYTGPSRAKEALSTLALQAACESASSAMTPDTECAGPKETPIFHQPLMTAVTTRSPRLVEVKRVLSPLAQQAADENATTSDPECAGPQETPPFHQPMMASAITRSPRLVEAKGVLSPLALQAADENASNTMEPDPECAGTQEKPIFPQPTISAATLVQEGEQGDESRTSQQVELMRGVELRNGLWWVIWALFPILASISLWQTTQERSIWLNANGATRTYLLQIAPVIEIDQLEQCQSCSCSAWWLLLSMVCSAAGVLAIWHRGWLRILSRWL